MSVVVQIKAWLGRSTPAHHVSAEVFCLYWHFVDGVWIFVFSSLFLSPHMCRCQTCARPGRPRPRPSSSGSPSPRGDRGVDRAPRVPSPPIVEFVARPRLLLAAARRQPRCALADRRCARSSALVGCMYRAGTRRRGVGDARGQHALPRPARRCSSARSTSLLILLEGSYVLFIAAAMADVAPRRWCSLAALAVRGRHRAAWATRGRAPRGSARGRRGVRARARGRPAVALGAAARHARDTQPHRPHGPARAALAVAAAAARRRRTAATVLLGTARRRAGGDRPLARRVTGRTTALPLVAVDVVALVAAAGGRWRLAHPALYDAAVRHPPLHALEHVTLRSSTARRCSGGWPWAQSAVPDRGARCSALRRPLAGTALGAADDARRHPWYPSTSPAVRRRAARPAARGRRHVGLRRPGLRGRPRAALFAPGSSVDATAGSPSAAPRVERERRRDRAASSAGSTSGSASSRFARSVAQQGRSPTTGRSCSARSRMYCFVVLVLTGIYLTFFFHPERHDRSCTTAATRRSRRAHVGGVRVDGRASASTCAPGWSMRQIHHWAALRVPRPRSSRTSAASSSPARSGGHARSTGSSA